MTTHQPLSQIFGLPKKAITTRGMNIVREYLMLFGGMFALFSSLPADAQSVIPTSYVATPGEGVNQGATFNYYDDTGSQLTDGIYGGNSWSGNLGNGPAYEWVGWRVANPAIAFQFSTTETISHVGIDFNRTEADGLFLPSTVTIDGTAFTVDPNAIPDNTRGTLYFYGDWMGSTMNVDLSDGNTSNWIFVDEITFNSVCVPEPSVFGLLAGGFGLLILCRRCRKIMRQF